MNANQPRTADIDEVLRDYFRAEMPEPWPAWTAPPTTLRRATSWSRWAVAASVGLLLAAYLALSGYFPREASERLNNDPSRDIGQKMPPRK
jgi:hypothetical protein